MARLSIFFCLALFIIIFLTNAAPDEDEVYIVYMGGKGSSNPETLRDDQALLLNTLSNRNAVVHVYKHGFTGFAARMSKEEANLIVQYPGVVSVFPDKTAKLLTTRSWSFLQQLSNSTLSRSTSTAKGADTIIAIVDTGIWPESKSFSDEYMGPVPKRWKGTCVESHDFPASSCNRKLIGARHFLKHNKTCRDFYGHGTHMASTAAGAPVPGASYYGLDEGTAIGGSPSSRIAVYKVCGISEGCEHSAILAGMDAAIHDRVDVMSLSIGNFAENSTQILDDSLAIGGFHAIEHGITVVCAGGNGGPESSVTNFTPWLTTVAASTIDRQFEANVVLGNNQVIKGACITFSDLSESPIYPLIDVLSAKPANYSASRDCDGALLDGSKVKGKIVLCFNDDLDLTKSERIMEQGGVGVILVADIPAVECAQQHVDVPTTFPVTVISSNEANVVLSYIQSYGNPTATILRSATSLNYKPTPSIADFSSSGPSYLTHNLLKPDISAPGVIILAAWTGTDKFVTIPGRKTPEYVIKSGTSMAAANISGVAAIVKSQHPTWDHSAIRSAIMTTAIQTDTDGAPITRVPGLEQATPYDFGAGEVNIAQAIDPGLIYETSTMDYYIFLCNYGYNESQIKLITDKIPKGFSCPEDASEDLISNMNYPSIAVADFNKTMYKKVTRTVRNVGDEDETVYSVTVDPPQYLNVQVIPEKLEFTKENNKKSFHVIFSTEYHYQSDVFGWITWSNGKYRVRSPFAISFNNSQKWFSSHV